MRSMSVAVFGPLALEGPDAQPEGARGALGAGAPRGPSGHDRRARRCPLGRRAARDLAEAAAGVDRPAADRDRAQRHRDLAGRRTRCASTPTPSTPSGSNGSRHPLDSTSRTTRRGPRTPPSAHSRSGEAARTPTWPCWAPALVESERLDEVRMELEEVRLDARLRLGEHAASVAEAEGLVREAPLRERRWVLLATALYRSGRQADALAAIRRPANDSPTNSAWNPAPELSELELGILRHDDALDLDETPSVPAPHARIGGCSRSASRTRTSSSGGTPTSPRRSPGSPVGLPRRVRALGQREVVARARRVWSPRCSDEATGSPSSHPSTSSTSGSAMPSGRGAPTSWSSTSSRRCSTPARPTSSRRTGDRRCGARPDDRRPGGALGLPRRVRRAPRPGPARRGRRAPRRPDVARGAARSRRAAGAASRPAAGGRTRRAHPAGCSGRGRGAPPPVARARRDLAPPGGRDADGRRLRGVRRHLGRDRPVRRPPLPVDGPRPACDVPLASSSD